MPETPATPETPEPAGAAVPAVGREKPDLNAMLRDVPHKPGVYLMKDRLNRIIYVGKARSLRKRLSNYFQPSRKTMADRKTRALIQSIWDFEYHIVRNEPESLLLEGKLIKEYRPKYNVSFRDDKRFLLIKVHMEDPYPKFQLTRVRKEDGGRYFGPFAHSGALRTTVAWINRELGLRSCRPLRPSKQDYLHCNDDIIKNCTAPCMARVTEEAYKERIEEGCKMLEGKSKTMMKSLEEEMAKAAAKLDFEKAAHLRDTIADLKKTLVPTRQFRRGRGVPTTVLPLEDLAELGDYLSLPGPPKIMECFDISNISTSHNVASMVRFRDGAPDNQHYRRYRIKTVDGQDDFASMAEVVRRRYSRILLEASERVGDDADFLQDNPLEAARRIGAEAEEEESVKTPKRPFVRIPDLVIVDGGKGQLSSAVAELQRLGLGGLPIIGLAKQREEVFFPGESDPLTIPHDKGALKLLQRIRDEAHRFANGYHQLLMKRRIHESLLDDCPGVSQRRKKALLTEFGSVSRLKKAGEGEIAQVSGISPALAADIVRFLATR